MDEQLWDMTVRTVLVLLTIIAISSWFLLVVVHRQRHAIDLKPEATVWTTLRAVPLALPIALDLMDLGFDFLSAPVVWVVLSRWEMIRLRNVAMIVALIPGTQLLPIVTLLWLAARVFQLGDPPSDWQRRLVTQAPPRSM